MLVIGSGQWIKKEYHKGLLLFLLSYAVLPAFFLLTLSVSDFLAQVSIVLLPPAYLGLVLYSAMDAWA